MSVDEAIAAAQATVDCIKNREDTPVSNLANAVLTLKAAFDSHTYFAYDEMACEVLLLLPLPGTMEADSEAATFRPRQLTDVDVYELQVFLQRHRLPNLSAETTHQAVEVLAKRHAFHPVRQYLQDLKWDGTERLGRWLTYHMGAEDTPYARGIGRMFLIAMVARVFEPGCKADYMMVLEGPQGLGKSTACAILGGNWFTDSLPDLQTGKEVSQHLRGRWLVEVPEMHALSTAENSALKSFLTRQSERYRPPFGRREVTEPRQCVFIGTHNQSTYLHDETGGRRYWPVRVTSIDIAGLRRERDQLFAEAVNAYRKGEQWWPDGDWEAQHIKPQQAERYEGDAWEDAIRPYLRSKFTTNQNPRITISEVATAALDLPVGKIGTRDQRRIGACLTQCGWVKGNRGTGGTRYWVPPQGTLL
jgi:predicted P-loop ATPase